MPNPDTPTPILREPAEPDPLALVLAALPDVVEALLREHQPDAAGLCRSCGRPGTGAAHLRWPCPLWRIAEAARTIRGQRAGR